MEHITQHDSKKVYTILDPCKRLTNNVPTPHNQSTSPPLLTNTSMNLGWTGLEGENSELWPQL